MRLDKAMLWLSTLLVLGGCGDSEVPPTPLPDAGTPPPQLTRVTVTCEPTSLVAGASAQCTASAMDQTGAPFNVSGYTWTSSNEAVARVDPAGRATAVTTGTANILASATAGQLTRQGQAALTVTRAAPTVHAADITTPETWHTSDNPHVVRGSIAVTGANAPTLTLEAGVALHFEQGAELRVTSGALRAMGTQAAGIRMGSGQGTPTPGYWRGVVFSAPESASELAYVTLSDCGNASGRGACLALENRAAPVLRDVTVQNSATAGVGVADDGSAFGAGSTKLGVSGSAGYAVRIGANQASTLPADSTFTNNTPNAVELRGNVTRSQTWPSPGIPYVVAGLIQVQGEAGPTLTLAAGTVVRFGSDSALLAGEEDPGNLVVAGTAASPVLLTADSGNPQPGHWRGVHLGQVSSSDSRLSNVTIEYAGAAGSGGRGNLNVYGNASGVRPVITNVVVQKSSEYGVYLAFNGAFGEGSAGLSARDNGRHHIGVEANSASTIPADSTFSGAPGTVEIHSGNVAVTQTWPDLRIPYVISSSLNVGSASTPTLTLLPGTEVRVGQGVELSVGGNVQPGALRAVGTAERPIRFVPNAEPPTAGSWRGLHFWQATGSRLDHAVVSHAGAEGSPGRGNVNVHRELGAFMTNTTLAQSSLCGVAFSDGTQAGTTRVTTDFTRAEHNNTFTDNPGRQCIIE